MRQTRVPITADADLWEEAVRLGREVLWLETYGRVSGNLTEGRSENIRDRPGIEHPTYLEPVRGMPAELSYNQDSGTLEVGTGRFGPVAKEVVEYEVGGVNVLKQWFGYRKQNPNGLIKSDLDLIVPDKWLPAWSTELLEVLSALTQLVELHKGQASLLGQITATETLNLERLRSVGVKWPSDETGRKDRAVRYTRGEKLFE